MKINIIFEAQTVKEEKILRGLLKQARDPTTALGKLISQKKAKLITSTPKKGKR
jgi:hypothetical protein